MKPKRSAGVTPDVNERMCIFVVWVILTVYVVFFVLQDVSWSFSPPPAIIFNFLSRFLFSLHCGTTVCTNKHAQKSGPKSEKPAEHGVFQLNSTQFIFRSRHPSAELHPGLCAVVMTAWLQHDLCWNQTSARWDIRRVSTKGYFTMPVLHKYNINTW